MIDGWAAGSCGWRPRGNLDAVNAEAVRDLLREAGPSLDEALGALDLGVSAEL